MKYSMYGLSHIILLVVYVEVSLFALDSTLEHPISYRQHNTGIEDETTNTCTIMDAGVEPRSVLLVASTVVSDAGSVLVESCGYLIWSDVLADGDPRCCVVAADNSLCVGVGSLRGGGIRGVRVMIVTAIVLAAMITESGTVTVTGDTTMMLVSAKVMAVEMMSKAMMMLIVVTLMAAQVTATTAIIVVSAVVAACDTAMATGGKMAAVMTTSAASTMMMAADSILMASGWCRL